MGFLDQLKGRATQAVDQHGDKIVRGIDRAAAAADQKTKGKYSRHIGTGTSKAKEAIDRLDKGNRGGSR